MGRIIRFKSSLYVVWLTQEVISTVALSRSGLNQIV